MVRKHGGARNLWERGGGSGACTNGQQVSGTRSGLLQGSEISADLRTCVRPQVSLPGRLARWLQDTVELLRMCLASCWVPWQSTAAAHSNAPCWCAAGGLVGLARPVSSSQRHMMAPCACWIRRRGALSCSSLMRRQSTLPWIACQVSAPLFPAVADHVSCIWAAVCRA